MTLAKGKLRRINGAYAFHQTDDYERESYNSSQNTLALWLVEKIRHRIKESYRYDLRFTIIPINGKIDKNLHDLRKRVFILRDIDYPEYFSSSQQIKARSDILTLPTSRNYNRVSPLNFGEYHAKSLMSMRRPPPMQPNNFNRFPIRFPDSHEVSSSPSKHVIHVRQKLPFEKNYLLDHRGGVHDINKQHDSEGVKSERNSFFTVPMIAVPQMSFIHIPYSIPLQFQVPISTNQRSLSMPHPKKLTQTENLGVNSIRVQKFSLPDQKNLKDNDKNNTKSPIKYSTILSESEDQNNDFRPIIPPSHYMRRDRATTTTTTSTTTTPISLIEKAIRIQKKNETRKLPKRLQTSTTESTLETTVKIFDIVATRPSLIDSQTTDRSVLKWYPKKQRIKFSSSSSPAVTTIQPTTVVETTPIMRNNSNNSSTRSLIFRGRNRFTLNLNREKNRTTTTEKSSALSSKWKAITSKNLLPTKVLQETTTKRVPNYATTIRENESTTPFPQTKVEVELVSANVEEVNSNSSNIDIFKAAEVDDDHISSTSTTILTTTLN